MSAKQCSYLTVLSSSISSSCHFPWLICPSVVLVWTDCDCKVTLMSVKAGSELQYAIVYVSGSHPWLRMRPWNLQLRGGADRKYDWAAQRLPLS